MRSPVRIALLTAIAGCLCGYTAAAQSTQPGQNPQTTQNQDSYTGVSRPPADNTIQADEDLPAPAPAPKPSPAILKATTPPPAARNSTGENPAYGMVGDNTSVSLQRRAGDGSDDIVSFVPDNPNELAEGTNIRVQLSEDLSTADTVRGARFRARVTGNIYKDGRVIIPAGSELRGRVVQVSQGHHLGPHATIRLLPEELVVPSGTEYHLMAEVVESEVSGTRVNQEGGIEASVRYKKDALEYGAGAGAGAVAGAAVAGPVGAGVGSLVGAGAVSAHMLMTHPEAANLPQGSVLIFSLTEPMELRATRD
ncbi:MAG TPA: hypothetical protein VHX37_00845 [Acidobacteriaceae bacterium]|jgi:hypothetical protein|nr:hypothetical protein [Acidobacteriaceae bacterium]